MSHVKSMFPAVILAVGLSAGGALSLASGTALAQAANPPPAPAMPGHPAHPRPMRSSHIEGRIAYLKAELKITPDQEAAFDKVAQAMRQNDSERRQMFDQFRANRNPQNENALRHLETMARLSAMHTQAADRFLAAFRPLYDSLSPAQKQSADGLLDRFPRHGGHFGGRFR